MTVPSLAGQPLDVAEQRLNDLGLHSSEEGGGLFGVLIPSDWDVCETSPGRLGRLPGLDRPARRSIVRTSAEQLSRRATLSFRPGRGRL